MDPAWNREGNADWKKRQPAIHYWRDPLSGVSAPMTDVVLNLVRADGNQRRILGSSKKETTGFNSRASSFLGY